MANKFEWAEGEVELTLSQCSNCKNNAGGTKCKEFGTKPDKYFDNEEKCPAHKKE